VIQIPICTACRGIGLNVCPTCGGTGREPLQTETGKPETKRCTTCGGAAFIGPCPSCNGRGKISWDEALVLEEL
jgi:DnaJ-class molecular chaperone